MEITEVRIKLVEKSSERLRAFCSVTLDGDFVVRDLKVIDGTTGPFVAMPSRKLMDRCARCGAKNHLRAKFCNECSQRLNENRAPKDGQGRAKLHADVAHPINAACRERIQKAVVQAYHEELERAKSPDYKPARYDDFEDIEEHDAGREPNPPAADPPPPPPRAKDASPAGTEPAAQGFGDYNELIADLKRQAETRRGDREPPPAAPEQTSAPPPSPPPPHEPEEEPTGRDDNAAAGKPVRPAPAPPPAPDEEFGSGL